LLNINIPHEFDIVNPFFGRGGDRERGRWGDKGKDNY
jgi:hypothetical protein